MNDIGVRRPPVLSLSAAFFTAARGRLMTDHIAIEALRDVRRGAWHLLRVIRLTSPVAIYVPRRWRCSWIGRSLFRDRGAVQAGYGTRFANPEAVRMTPFCRACGMKSCRVAQEEASAVSSRHHVDYRRANARSIAAAALYAIVEAVWFDRHRGPAVHGGVAFPRHV